MDNIKAWMPRCVQFLTSLKLPFEKDSQPFNPRQMGREYTVYTVYTLYSHCTKQRLCGTVLRGGMLERVRISKRKRQMSSELFGTYHSTILYSITVWGAHALYKEPMYSIPLILVSYENMQVWNKQKLLIWKEFKLICVGVF